MNRLQADLDQTPEALRFPRLSMRKKRRFANMIDEKQERQRVRMAQKVQ